MADSIPKFHDAAERAPIGGWHYFYDPQDGSTMFKKGSAGEVVDELVRYRSNNGTLTSREAIEAEVWKFYCSRQPERCGQARSLGEPVAFIPRDQKPEFFGPIIWKFLNLAATRFNDIGRERFLEILNSVIFLMSCPDCRESWAKIAAANPPVGVNNAKTACQYVNHVHNLVNRETGHALYPYERGVTEYGFPV